MAAFIPVVYRCFIFSWPSYSPRAADLELPSSCHTNPSSPCCLSRSLAPQSHTSMLPHRPAGVETRQQSDTALHRGSVRPWSEKARGLSIMMSASARERTRPKLIIQCSYLEVGIVALEAPEGQVFRSCNHVMDVQVEGIATVAVHLRINRRPRSRDHTIHLSSAITMT